MPSKQITFTPNEAATSFVMVLDDRDYAAKKQMIEMGTPQDVDMQPYEMYKTTATNTSLVPASEMEVLKTFGTVNGNKILEFIFLNGNTNGTVEM